MKASYIFHKPFMNQVTGIDQKLLVKYNLKEERTFS